MFKWLTSAKNYVVFTLLSCYMVFFCVWFSMTESASVDNYATVLFPWIISSLLIQFFCFVFIKKVSMSDMGLWFLLLSYLFMYGYLFIDVLEMESSLLWLPIKEYSQAVLYDATLFVNLSLNMFSLGYLISYRKAKDKAVLENEQNEKHDIKKFRVGVLLCLIGGICQLITSWTLIRVTQNAGSYTAYTQAASSGILDDLAFLFVPGVIYILASKKMTSSKAFMFTGIIIVYFCAIMLLSGSRKTQIFGIVAVVICYLHMYKPPKFKVYQKVIILVGSAVFLNMIYVIRENRTDLSQTIPAFFKSISDLEFIRSLVPEVLAETGITFCSVASVVKCVPDIFSFEYGMPFFRALVSLLPIGWLIPDFFAKASTTMTINKYLGLPVGGSLLADFYWNFGVWGSVLAFIFGVLLATCFVKLNKKSSEVYFSIFYILMIGVRAGMFELVRPLFVVTFIPWIFRRVLESKE